MTAYVTFQALKAGTVSPDTKVVCSQKARTQAPTKLGLPVGAAITLDVALKVLIVKSANDVAVMIAETVARSEQAFVARMNEEAQRLGMSRTKFANVKVSLTSGRSPRPAIWPSSPAPLSSSFLNTPISSLRSKCMWARRPCAPRRTASLSAYRAPDKP